MRDKIIKIENGTEYYVLDVLVEERQIYLLCSETDSANDEFKNNAIVCKVIEGLDGLSVEKINDDFKRAEVTKKFMKMLNPDF